MSSNRSLASLSALVEQASTTYSERFDIPRSPDWFVLKLFEEVGEFTSAYLDATHRSRRKLSENDAALALQDELADVFAHVMLVATHLGIDLDAGLQDKWFKHLPDPNP
ncbi:MAG: pyrophosphatase [Propionibacteriaceae bacterium]|nr:pyrophosphatase [Propionibacteriaceae bacterium]